ncbi:hypothetical protein EUGRSUZ_E02156 [Eucalyptus grandis]|uniref:Uncharacterized protein n=2 Tax=Eucalyptus grandis TaxID=71139 RepID=A0ACC3KZD1_EUCGR|nr:hypothetical protein EUGRSUZ_E02156 [Eucalyptus grandis]
MRGGGLAKTSDSTNASSSIPTPAISDKMEEDRPAEATEAMETDDDSLPSCVIGEKQCLIAAGRNRTTEKPNPTYKAKDEHDSSLESIVNMEQIRKRRFEEEMDE